MSDVIRVNIAPVSDIPYELTPEQALNVGIQPAIYKGEPGASGKSPYIGEDNYWYEYDDDAQRWVKTDVYADEAAAAAAFAAAESAKTATQEANTAAEAATQAADDAKTRTDEALADAQRTLDAAVSGADEAVKKAVADAEAATGAATDAAGKANTAADGANVQANAAEQAAQSAGNAAGSAQTATEAAQEAARKALDAAERANNAASGAGFQKEVLDHLPEPSEMADNVLYLVPAAEPNPDNVYEEYMLINGQRELIGSTAVDLSGYAKTEDVDARLAKKLDITGTAAAATKATQDGAGNNINTTYVKSVTIDGTTVTITRGDDSTTQQTTQDTTYDQATDAKLGLVKLYGSTGAASDGAMTQAAITAALAGKADVETITEADIDQIFTEVFGA